jgi:starch phosphorylase
MKFMMNGAVTIGTLDGANVEIREAVGEDNFFLFGLSVEGIAALRMHYNPRAIIAADEDLRRVFELVDSAVFNPDEPGIFDGVTGAMRDAADHWMTVADAASFFAAQQRAATAYRDVAGWTRMSILNTAASGRFSSDRTIRAYNDEIWRLQPIGP